MEGSEQKNAFPEHLFPILLKYVDLSDVFRTLSVLNRASRDIILSENYIIYKHFLRTFNLNDRLKRADIPAKVDIIRLVKDNVMVKSTRS